MKLRDVIRLRATGDHDVSTGSERRIAAKRNQPRPMSTKEIERAIGEPVAEPGLLEDDELEQWPKRERLGEPLE